MLPAAATSVEDELTDSTLLRGLRRGAVPDCIVPETSQEEQPLKAQLLVQELPRHRI